jgi:hypothetical protein
MRNAARRDPERAAGWLAAHRGHPYFQPAPAIIAPLEADLARV